MNPIVEAVGFLLEQTEKHAAHPHTAAKAARLKAEIAAFYAAGPDAPREDAQPEQEPHAHELDRADDDGMPPLDAVASSDAAEVSE
jgi:ubiquitin